MPGVYLLCIPPCLIPRLIRFVIGNPVLDWFNDFSVNNTGNVIVNAADAVNNAAYSVSDKIKNREYLLS
jgi:hypothetical protein